MRPRWRKVLADLIENKARTVLVVFSIAVGVFAIGVIAGAYVIISQDLGVTYAANNPANLEIHMVDFDQDLQSAIQNTSGVKDAEARRLFNLRIRPQGESSWTVVNVVAVDDFEEIEVNLLQPYSGAAEAGENQILLEYDVLKDLKISPGEVLEIQLRDESIKEVTVAGVVRDASTGAIDFLSPPLAYITREELGFFGQPDLYNILFVTLETGQDDDDHIRSMLTDIKDKIQSSGYGVGRTFRSRTHQHPLEPTINAVLGILMALGVLIVFLSSSLIANTLSALLKQHLRHIGIMKLIGGRDGAIFRMYLVLLLAFGTLALLIAVPAGGQGAYALAQFIADQLGFALLAYRIVPLSFLIQIAVGILVPLLAGFVPVISGSRITVQQALEGDEIRASGGGTVGPQNHGARLEELQIDLARRLADRGIRVPRQLLLSIRNTFRQTSRLLLTLFTLTMGGAIFISVYNVRDTMDTYVENIGNYFLADVTLNFDRPYRLEEIKQYAYQDPRVTHVEGWTYATADILYPDGSTAENIDILAPPAASDLVYPMLVEGRWIQPGDEKKMAISEGIYSFYPHLQIGDSLPLKISGKEESWEIVGVFKFIDPVGVIGYSTYEYISREQNLANRSFTYRIQIQEHDRDSQRAMAKHLDVYFRENGFKVQESLPGLSSLDRAAEHLDILVTFLLIMALLTATVGSMGLTGTMSMNVLERTREIGIMRAIGATDLEIIRMVIVEGLLIGLISFGLAIGLAYPITHALSGIISSTIFATPITVVFTPVGYIIWLGLVILLSSLASVLPALNAARLTIREVLAYE